MEKPAARIVSNRMRGGKVDSTSHSDYCIRTRQFESDARGGPDLAVQHLQ